MSRRSHTLTVNVTIDDPTNQMFWLDYLEYAPLEDVNLDGNTLKIDSSDVRVTYNNGSAQWRELSPRLNGTGVAGGSLSFKFNGTSVSLYTFLEGSEQDWNSSPARYHIDDSEDTSFTIPGSKRLSGSGNRSDFFNQLLFTSPNLSAGEHELTLSFDGVAQGGGPPIQWLIIDYFHVIAAGTNLDGYNGTPVSVIVGAVVGGVVGLFAIGLAAYFLMRRQKKDRQLQGSMNSPWYGGASGGFGLGSDNHNYAAVTPFIPEEDSTRSTFYDPWNSSMSGRRSISTAKVTTTNTYPPEKSRHRLISSTSSSYPLASSSGSTPSLIPTAGQNSHVSPPTVLSPPSPPNVPAGNRTSYLDPFADFVPNSNASTRPMEGTQSTGTSNVIHVRHEDSGIRLPRGNDSNIQDPPPDYTRD
ncbi:hypothetical protein L218DRAFT_358086 [Marasmius fiardii PR-910]|nr:hypothetical protein L218DRAFT_358086 [Marasmius fiardii PR-910]